MIQFKESMKALDGEDKYTMKDGFSTPERNYDHEFFELQFSPRISQAFNMGNNKQQQESNILEILQASPQEQSRNPWTQGGLRIIFYITKFIKQIKSSSNQINFKFLTKEMVDLINDKASDNLLLNSFTQENRWCKTIRVIVNQIPIIEPESIFKIFWDTFVLIQIVINIFYIPMKLGFGLSNDSEFSSIFLESIPSWTFFTDIVLNFTTAYYQKGQIYRDKYGIFRHYIEYQFWLDLIIVVPFFLSSFDVPYTEYILLIRVTRVQSMISNLEEIINPTQWIQAIISLVKSVFFILFVTHFCACLWTLLGELQQQLGNKSWLEVKQIQDADWTSKYINSLYFSTITTLTVGYGDTVPTTDVERVFVILMSLVICGVLGYTISSIGEILKQLSLNRQKYKQQMMILNNYLKKKKLSKQLQLQVRKYFEYFLKMQENQDEDAEQMLQQLPKELKEQVAIDMHYDMLMKSRLIKNTLSNSSVLKLCKYVSERKYTPDDLIAPQHSTAQQLIFVQKGEIQLICQLNLQETILKTIGQQNFIGEREFILQSQYDYSIKTSKFTQLAYISYEDFMKVVREDVEVDEKFCMMRDSLKFNLEKQNYGQICPICGWTHQYQECPMVFLKVNKQRIIRECLSNVSQPRQMMTRKKNKQKINLQEIQLDALEFIIDNELLTNQELKSNTLEKYGFMIDSHTIFSQKSELNSNEKNESINSSKLNKPRMRMSKKISRIIPIHYSMFSIMEEQDANNMGMQSSLHKKISNNGTQNKTSFNLLPQLDSKKNYSDTSTLKDKSMLFEQESIIHQIQEESKQKLESINNIMDKYTNFDIDKQFLAKYYFINNNYDVVIAKLQENMVEEKFRFKMSRLRRRKNKL